MYRFSLTNEREVMNMSSLLKLNATKTVNHHLLLGHVQKTELINTHINKVLYSIQNHFSSCPCPILTIDYTNSHDVQFNASSALTNS